MDKFQKLVVASLRELGSTPKQVAKSLKARRIKGYVGNANSCPLANYLKKEFGVDSAYVDEDIKVNGVELPTFPLVDNFIAKFDKNAYPELEQ